MEAIQKFLHFFLVFSNGSTLKGFFEMFPVFSFGFDKQPYKGDCHPVPDTTICLVYPLCILPKLNSFCSA